MMSNIFQSRTLAATGADKRRSRQPVALIAAALLVCVGANAQQAPSSTASITPNYKDADLAQITEAVSAVTGKTFIIDPRVKAQVTMLSSTPMSPAAFYQAYLSILQVHGFVAVPAGNIIKIIPDANARQVPGNDLPDNISSTSDELVTQVVAVRNISATQLVPILRPLIPQYGQLAAYPASNMLIITDRANNVSRMMRIIERIDRATDDEIEIINLQSATAAEIVKTVNALSATAGAAGVPPGEGGQALKVVADDRTNSVLISGEKSARLRIKTLITYLDTPLQSGGNTKTRYLEYADAEGLATNLKAQIQGITQSVTGTAPGGAAPAAAASAASNSVSIWADKATNALVVSAPPKIMEQIMSIVDTLDIRRAQVHVEAIVVEVSASKAAELGINWALYGSDGSNVPAGVFSGGSTPISSLAGVVGGDYSAIPSGTTLGIGRIVDSGASFAAILRALQEDGNTNVISTPSIITLDNQEAKIEVTQEVPFITGQYSTGNTTSGSTGSSSVNPFTTISREDVGTKLTITPKINKGGSVMLKISQEASSLSQQTGDAGSLITNKRAIENQVMVEDGQTIVLGGLLEDRLTEGASRVPILGSIPILGNLFKARNSKKDKTNLLVFIKPTILRDGVQASIETNSKYNFIRDLQLERNKGKVSLQPGEKQPVLPVLQDKQPPAPVNEGTPDTGSLTTSPLNATPGAQ